MDIPEHSLGQRSGVPPSCGLKPQEDVSSRLRTGAGGGLAAEITRFAFGPSQDPRQVLRLRRYFGAAGTSLLAIGLLFACQVQGVISEAAFFEISAVILVAIVIFYAVLRSGLNLKLRDPSLTEPQMLTATVVVLY